MISRGQGRSETSRLLSMYHTPGTYIDTFYRGEKGRVKIVMGMLF